MTMKTNYRMVSCRWLTNRMSEIVYVMTMTCERYGPYGRAERDQMRAVPPHGSFTRDRIHRPGARRAQRATRTRCTVLLQPQRLQTDVIIAHLGVRPRRRTSHHPRITGRNRTNGPQPHSDK